MSFPADPQPRSQPITSGVMKPLKASYGEAPNAPGIKNFANLVKQIGKLDYNLEQICKKEHVSKLLCCQENKSEVAIIRSPNYPSL